MADVREQYTDELYENFGYFATWEPGTTRELGEVGELRNNEFIRVTNLKNLKIDFKIIKDEVKHELNYSSKGSVKLTQKLNGKTTPVASVLAEADAGFVLEFGKEKSVFLKAIGVVTEQIDDQASMSQEILKRYNEGKWEKQWVVINELKRAESATIVISNSANSKIEISAKAALGKEELNIADATLDLSIVASQGINTEIIAKTEVTPLFRLKGIKKPFFGKETVQNKGVENESAETESVEEEVSANEDFIEFDEIKYTKSK